jgi:hypothetical protein
MIKTMAEVEAEFIKRIFRGKEAMPTEDLVLAMLSQPEVAFGVRVYPLFRNAGIRRQATDTDLDRNRHDVLRAERLLLELAAQCYNTLSMPRETAELLGRITNALGEVRHNRKPALFDMPEASLLPADVAGTQAEGRLAAALEILVRGGMKLAAAQKWLESEIHSAKLVDAAGDQIRASRVADWRKNFNQSRSIARHNARIRLNSESEDPPRRMKGAINARIWFNSELEDHKALLAAPRDQRKLAACQHYARAVIYGLAALFNRTIHPPQQGSAK